MANHALTNMCNAWNTAVCVADECPWLIESFGTEHLNRLDETGLGQQGWRDAGGNLAVFASKRTRSLGARSKTLRISGGIVTWSLQPTAVSNSCMILLRFDVLTRPVLPTGNSSTLVHYKASCSRLGTPASRGRQAVVQSRCRTNRIPSQGNSSSCSTLNPAEPMRLQYRRFPD
jgi:hypothetical protein